MKKTKVWAHRGASGYAPENTLEAFQLAAKMGADGVELDVQMSKDGQLVVVHDERIDRVSDGNGFVKDFSLAELKRFDFSKLFPDYETVKIPTLLEVYELLKDTDLYINVELKNGCIFYNGLEERLIALEKHMGMQDRILYSSFNHYSIKRMKELAPHVKTGILYCDGIFGAASYGSQLGADALHPSYYNLHYPEFEHEAYKYGLSVNVWTVNSQEAAEECLKKNVDGIITNYPDKMRHWIGSD